MKGGQASPMFPTGAKKRGCAFENPEPSSPKVTCIGQVRVKTKKQGKKLRTRSKRRGEASFRRVEQQNTSLNVTQQEVNVQNNSQFQSQQPLQQQQQQQQHECSSHRNQRWVHLPVTICEGLRAFGAEFNCFLPCRSSCMREKEEKAERSEGGGNGSSCGAVFARWLVAMQENEGKGGREIELVVGEEESETESVRRKSRREIFEGIEIKEERIEEEDQEEGRVSICVPPKNALLLMRCRSDPVKMAALANRFWESPVHDKDEDKDEDNENVEHEEGEEQQQQRDLEERQSKVEVDEVCDSQEHGYPEEKANLVLEEKIVVEENPELQQHPEEQENNEEEKLQVNEELFEEVNQPVPELKQEPEALVDPEVFEHNVVLQEIEDVQENEAEAEHEEEDEEEANFSSSTLVSIHSEQESEARALEEEEEQEAKVEALAEDEDEEESLSGTPWEDEETVTHERFEPEEEEDDPNTHEKEPGMEESKFGESQQRKPERERESLVLLDCLLLMMCEPKLSMEVSKETWVCSTDFIRWLPERPIKKTNGGDGKDPKKSVISTATEHNSKNPAPPTHTAAPHHLLLQPPRSSCSFPAAVAAAAAPGAGVSMATMIEQKLVGAKGYEPFVLTRCKSEPMRSSAKLMPEPCFWKNRKLEPHRPATLGVGAAGVGF